MRGAWCVIRSTMPFTHHVLRATLLIIVAAILIVPMGAAAQEPPTTDPRFGLVLVPPEQQWLQRAAAAGAGSNRYQLNWWDVEKTPGEFDWSIPDRDVSAMRAAGLEVTMLLHAPPGWARAPGSDWVPGHLDTPWDAPENAWGNFVYTTVKRYSGQVRYYEIFNEPDLNKYWDGSPEQYARLLVIAYQAAKAADPDAQIIMAGMAHWINPRFAEEVLRSLRSFPDAEENGYFFDVAAWHWYSSSYQLYDRVLWARDLLTRYGMGDKSIWINETNLPVWGDGEGPQEAAQGFGTPEEQAAFIVQAFTNAFAAGAERVFVFRLDDGDMDETFGLMRNGGTPRPGYHAYEAVSTWLGDSRFVTREVRDDAIVSIFRRQGGQRVTVVWNRTDRSVSVDIPAIADEATLISLTGERETITSSAATYKLELPAGRRQTQSDGSVVTPVGGAPYFIVEKDLTPPQVDLAGLPTLSANADVDLAWETVTPSEAPIDRYEVQVRIDGSAWEPWRTVDEPAVTYAGEMGHRYAFRVRAVDTNGQTSPWPPDEQPMAQTVVGGAVVGRVADVTDDPLVNERICAAGHCTNSDHAGVFRLEGLPPGETRVNVLGWNAEATVTVEAGAEHILDTLRPSLGQSTLQQSGFDELTGWVVLPRAGARIRTESDTTFAQLDAGTRLAQHILLPAADASLLYLRYRTAGDVSLDVRLMRFGDERDERRLFYDTNTLGEWREIAFDLGAFAGNDGLLVVRADGDAGVLSLDTVWLGIPPQRSQLFLPMITN